jgi:hypothetical protein
MNKLTSLPAARSPRLLGPALTHFPQLSVHKGQNSIGVCQKVLGYQLLFFENQM